MRVCLSICDSQWLVVSQCSGVMHVCMAIAVCCERQVAPAWRDNMCTLPVMLTTVRLLLLLPRVFLLCSSLCWVWAVLVLLCCCMRVCV